MPEQFYGLTIREYSLMTNGYVEANNNKLETYAWMVTNLMNVHLQKKDRVKVSDLLPKDDKASKLKQALAKTASSKYHREQDVMKLLEANSGKFNG